MAENNFRQPYQQRPPPQQGYYDRQYEPRNPRSNGQEYLHNQRNQGYNEHYNGRYDEEQRTGLQSNDDQYGNYEQWNHEQYQNSQYHDQYDQRHQQYNSGPTQPRQYQYDDRYHVNEPSRPPMQHSQSRPQTRSGGERPPPPPSRIENTSRNGSVPSYGPASQQPRVKERILQQQPESPKASWDNPFPAFPSKKKQAESKRPTSSGQSINESGTTARSPEVQRPSTSHSSRPRAEPHPDLPRPRTAQSQRHAEPFSNTTDMPTLPANRDHADPPTQTGQYHGSPPNSSGSNNNQFRPGPRRVMTEPPSNQQFHDHGQSDLHFQDDGFANEPVHREYLPQMQPGEQGYHNPTSQRFAQELDYQPRAQPKLNTTMQQHSTHSGIGHRRQSSSQSYRKPVAASSQDYDSSSYRGVPLTKKVSPEMPNFDAIPVTPTEKAEDHLPQSQQQQQQDQPYHKPVYQNGGAPQFDSRQQHHTNDGNALASPLAQFTFNLDSGGPPREATETPRSPAYYAQQHELREHQNPQRTLPPLGPDRPMQYPQRSASRPQEFTPQSSAGPPNRPPQGRPLIRAGLAQPPVSNQPYENEQQRYDYDASGYDANYAQGDGGSYRPTMPPSQPSNHSDTSHQGFDQRTQARFEFGGPRQVPPRPATSGSNRAGPGPNYGPRTSSDTYQRNGMQNPDSLPAHPAPFRPGLMQPAPPIPRPTPPPQRPQPQLQSQPQTHQRAPSGPKPLVEPETPVTIRELNTLREDFKNRPNDHALGLRFAKRLVEAAKVLSNENGRADAKQTAKNRERYILDAHKIVKRLCGSGYGEAMFYLADCYGQGLLGLEADPKEAFSLYQSAAKLGHPQSAYRVAVCCELGAEEGGGTRRDPLKAVQWYKRAATLGDTPAMYKMGMIQLKGLLGQQKSPREAISWLKRAAERADEENPHALHELALLYENAQSTDFILRDEQYALQLFQQAADLGYKYSQFRLGSVYEYGLLGLPIDPRMSIAWYSRAAKQGEHQSEFALSGWYLTGSGQAFPGEQPLLQQSDTEAYLWARKAASSGLAKAEYAMGYYTEVGIGVASNIEEAKRWYYRAAAQNHQKARERLEDLKRGGQRMQKTRVSRSNVGKHNEGECVVM